MKGGRAAFIDRDGTVNALVPDPQTGRPESPLRADDVRLIPGAARALRELAAAGWLLVGVTNQPAAAKGLVSTEELMAVQARVLGLLEASRVHLDAVRMCLHHPEGVLPGLSGTCDCRKPEPGMLLDAARDLDVDLGRSWMIGDTDADVLAGKAAGCGTVLLTHEPSSHKRSRDAGADIVVPNLEAAARLLLGRERVN